VFAIREPPQIRVKTPGVNPSSLAFLPAPSACPCLRAWRPDRILASRLCRPPAGRATPMTEPAITPELVAKHNLTPEEYAKILEILGRQPTYTELGIFS